MGAGTGGGKILWSILWFILLIFIAFPVAFFCSWLYIILVTFTPCIDGLKVRERQAHFIHSFVSNLIVVCLQGATDFLLKGVNFTEFCAGHMMKGSSFDDAF